MKTDFLKKIFCVPDYLLLPSAGIEICNKSIRYIELGNRENSFFIKNFGEVPLSPNIFKDGQILNRSALASSLSEVRNKISTNFVKVSIPEEKTYIFDVQMPKEAKANIREALEFKIEENVPLKLSESYFEYEIVEDKNPVGDVTVSVFVIPEKVISAYAEVFAEAGLYSTSYEIESKMIADSVIKKGEKGNYIILDIKEDSTVFIAVADGFVRNTSTISVGESLIENTLLKTSSSKDEISDGDYFDGDSPFDNRYTKESYSSLANIFSILKDEVEKFNEYISNKFSNSNTPISKNIKKVILCGKSSMLPGLAKHINQNLHTEVVQANAWSNVFDGNGYVPDIKFDDALSFVTPIGLVISSYE